MKRTVIAIVLAVCLAGLTGLGALAMSRGNEHDMPFRGCLATAAQGGVPCPADNSLNFSLFHLDALKKFSTAYLPSLAVLVLVAMAIGTMILFRDKSQYLPAAIPVLVNDFLTLGSAYKTKNEFFSWISLLEKSPAIF